MEFWSLLRSCARCSSSWPPIDLLCEKCWTALELSIEVRTRNLFGETVEVRSLWDWSNGPSEIGQIIKQRKAPCFDGAHRRLVRLYLRNEGTQFFNGARTLLYPTKTPGKMDHGSSLANAFSEALGLPAVPLALIADSEYRFRGQRERLALRRARPINKSRVPRGPYVMIDDVVTTGATARALWWSVGKPKGFKVAVLAYKTKSHGFSL